MDQVKLGVAMAVVAAIIVWISGEYAVEAWRDHRVLRRAELPAEAGGANQAAPCDDPTSIPPTAAA